MTYTEILTDLGLDTGVDAITPDAYAATTKMVLGTLGCAIAPHGPGSCRVHAMAALARS